jgi:hypothetical protein
MLRLKATQVKERKNIRFAVKIGVGIGCSGIGCREPGNVRESGAGYRVSGTGLFDYDNDYDHDNEKCRRRRPRPLAPETWNQAIRVRVRPGATLREKIGIE